MSAENRNNEYFTSSPSPEEVKAEYVGRVSPDGPDMRRPNNGSSPEPPFHGNGMNGNAYRPPHNMNGNPSFNAQTPPGYRPAYTGNSNIPPQAPPQPPKEKVKADFSDIAALLFTLITVFASACAVFSELNGIITACIQIAFLVFVTVIIRKKNKTSVKSAIFPGILSFLTAISNCMTPEMSFIKLVFSYYVFSIYCLALTGAKGYPLKSLVNIFHQARAFLLIPVRKMLLPATSVFRNIKLIPIGQILGICGGVILGIPFLITTAFLLSNADMAFSGMLTDFFEAIFNYIADIFKLSNIAVFIMTVIITPLLYSFIFSAKHGVISKTLGDNKSENTVIKLGFVHSSFLLGFYGVISLCYITYIFSQFRYLFSGFSGIVPEGTEYTLSQYARQGFFEMSGVALINLILISLGSVFAKRKNKTKLPKTYKFFSAFFCLFTVLITVTAISKMVLYVSELGFTEKRILVLIADIILLVAFISILLKLFIKKFPYLKIISYFALTLICVYCVIGTDALIAHFNTEMYISGKHESVHIDTIAGVSDDNLKITNLDKLTDSPDESIAISAKEIIYYLYLDHTEKDYKAVSVSDILCDNYIRKNKNRIEGYREFCYELAEDKDISAEIRYDNSYIPSSSTLNVDVPGRYVTFEFSNELVSTVCKTTDGSAFGKDAVIIANGWVYPENTSTIATVKATDTEGKEYTFRIEKGSNIITDETQNIVYTNYSRSFRGTVTYKEGDMLIYQ